MLKKVFFALKKKRTETEKMFIFYLKLNYILFSYKVSYYHLTQTKKGYRLKINHPNSHIDFYKPIIGSEQGTNCMQDKICQILRAKFYSSIFTRA